MIKGMNYYKKSTLMLRWILFVGAMFFMGIGVSLTTVSVLGTSPILSIALVLSYIFPFSIGQFTFYVSLIFLLLEIIIMGREFKMSILAQIVVGPTFGIFIDLGMRIFERMILTSYIIKFLILIIGCIILAFGIFLQVKANVVMNPGEALVLVIAERLHMKFGTIKTLFDSTLVSLAVLLSIFSLHSIQGVREGTIISAVIVGFIVKGYELLFSRLRLRYGKPTGYM